MEGVHLVERGAEQARLAEAVAAVMDGAGGFATLEGPAGIGKSGLLEHTRAHAGGAVSFRTTAQ